MGGQTGPLPAPFVVVVSHARKCDASQCGETPRSMGRRTTDIDTLLRGDLNRVVRSPRLDLGPQRQRAPNLPAGSARRHSDIMMRPLPTIQGLALPAAALDKFAHVNAERVVKLPSPRCMRQTLVLMLLAVGCTGGTPEDSYVRGHGLQVATISPDDESRIVEAAIRTAFDVEPALKLRLHPRRLARTSGDSGGTPIPPALVRSLRDRGLVLGTCEPMRTSPRDTPRCAGPEAGYVIRPSEVFTVSPRTLEMYLSVEKYGAATGQKPEALRFEKVYQVEKEDQRWRAVREARSKQ
jgi:hypothetical protein